MLRKVRIKKLPQAKTGFQVQGSLYNDVPSMGGGADYNAYMGKLKLETSKYITAVPRDEANLEAEGGETVYGDINGDGMPEHKTIKGPRHSAGGVPLKLPDDSFIFSDTKSMKIKEPDFLAMFGKKSGSYTPADLAKQYDIEKYRKILQDPESDVLDRKTAEIMLKNYALKLGALALAQESKKGFPQGIPAVARPYMEAMGLKDEDVLPEKQIRDTIEQLDQQTNNQRSADTMASPTEEQDEQYGPEAEEAQMMNSDRPVAQPEPEQDEAAGMMPQGNMQDYGMQMGGYTMPFHNQSYGMAKGGFSSFAFQKGGMQGSTGKLYQQAMQDYQWMLANPEAWQGDPEMTNPDGSLNLCLDCINVDWNSEDDIRDAHRLIEEGFSTGTHRSEEAFRSGLSKYELPDPVYKPRTTQASPVASPTEQTNTGQPSVTLSGSNQEMTVQKYGGWRPEDIAVFTGSVPEAAYGMAMGVNSQNYEGRTKPMRGASRFFSEGGNLPKAQTGAQVEVDVTGMTPEQRDRAFYNARTKPENKGKQLVEVNNGKKSNIKYSRTIGEDVEGVDMKIFGSTKSSTAAAAQYKLLETSLKDPEIMQKLCDETKASLKNPKSYVGKSGAAGKTWEQRGLAEPDCDQIKNQFLTHQKRNLAFQGQNIDPNLFTDTGRGLASLDEIIARKARDPETGEPITTKEQAEKARQYLSKTYGSEGAKDISINQISSKMGIPLEASQTDRALQQATFHGYAHMVDNMSKYDPEFQYKAKGFIGNIQRGVNDESSMQGLFDTKGVQISPIDDFTTADKSYYGNTTAGQLAAAGIDKYDVEAIDTACQCTDSTKEGYQAPAEDGTCPCDKKVEAKKCPCQKTDGTTIDVGVDPNTGACNPCVEDKKVDINQPAEWWLQDTIKTAGAFGDLMRIKKYMPWAPRVDLETPRPTFLDPTRELAANAEQANIQTQAMGQFAGAQAQSSRASSVQGNASKNAADILSRYNNANVNLGNQFEMQATNVRNQEQMANQAGAQRVYDQTTMANQQFDNAKLAMRNNLRNQYTNAMTNRSKTDALNQLYPQYAVSPGSGGFMRFTDGRELTGEGSGGGKSYDEWLKYYKDQGMNDSDAGANAKNAYNSQGGGGGTDNKAAILQQQYGKTGGQMKKGGFIYGDITYPFII